MIRGYRADGLDGPGIFSFEHHVHDTIPNGDRVFRFKEAESRADWIDTLHFYNEPPRCINQTFQEALANKSATQGIMIIHDDNIVYELYRGDFSADRLATVFSVSKSITSLLCGIAVDEGYIESIDDPVTKYLPELKGRGPRWEMLTIRYLLCMFSGLDFDDEYSFNIKELKTVNAIARLNYGHNLMKQIKGLKFRCDPGTEFRYESMTTAILGVVIERATGRYYADYLSEKVWKPLQMESVALINIDSRKHRAAHAFGGITCTLKDLAKIGRLYLNEGMWDGKRIVSREWIHLTTDFNPGSCYHYSWYDVRFEHFETGRYPGFYAIGIYNQVLYVNPHKKLIMVRIGADNIGWATIPEVFEQLSDVWPYHENALIEPNEQKPGFDGGDASMFKKWVDEHKIYPEEAKKAGIEGRVTTQFTITKEGKLTNVKVLRGVHPLLDQEALRVIESAPQKWKPGLNYKGEPRDVTYTFPVLFFLPKE